MSEDLSRIRQVYAERKSNGLYRDRYSPFNVAYQFLTQQRQRNILRLLSQEGIVELSGKRILEIGCGHGGILLELLSWGAEIPLVYGIDLLFDRVDVAKHHLPFLSLTCADGQYLPFPDKGFDIVLQYTVFSSILDEQIKANLAREMCRILKPNGLILWYDFWVNPTNLHTRGIRPTEIRHLFPRSQYQFRRITLAPPFARQVVPFSWLLAQFLEKLAFFNTHYLVAIRP